MNECNNCSLFTSDSLLDGLPLHGYSVCSFALLHSGWTNNFGVLMLLYFRDVRARLELAVDATVNVCEKYLLLAIDSESPRSRMQSMGSSSIDEVSSLFIHVDKVSLFMRFHVLIFTEMKL